MTKKIKSVEEYKEVEKILIGLADLVHEDTPVTDTNYLKFEACLKLIGEYDKIHYKIGKPSLAELLKLRMYEKRLTQRDLAKVLGISPSRISELLNGKAEPTMAIAKRMHDILNIQPAVFFR